MKRLSLFLVFLLIGILGLILDFKGDLVPVKNLFNPLIQPLNFVLDRSFDKVDNSRAALSSIFSLYAENKRLNDKVTTLESSQIKLAELLKENEILKNDLGFISNSELSFIPANVTARSPLGVFPSITLDKGQAEKVKEGAAVLESGFLLGQIRQVFEHTAVAWLITNPNLLVPVLLTNSRTNVLLKASLSGLVLEDIPQDVDIKVDEPVVTSGLVEDLPKGIAVGKVAKIMGSRSDIFKSAVLTSPLDFNRLEVVLINK